MCNFWTKTHVKQVNFDKSQNNLRKSQISQKSLSCNFQMFQHSTISKIFKCKHSLCLSAMAWHEEQMGKKRKGKRVLCKSDHKRINYCETIKPHFNHTA